MRIWDAPEAEPYPAPTVTSRDGVVEPPPSALSALQRDMEAAGWSTMLQYAYGAMPHSTTGRPLAAKPSWAIRMERADQGAVAVYRGGSWDTMYRWSADSFTRYATVTAFRAGVLED